MVAESLDKRLVIGVGTGRSGTRSLAELLNQHPDTTISHEMRPGMSWEPEQRWLTRRIGTFKGMDTRHVGDVAYWHLNYLDRWIEQYDAQVVGLMRDREAVVTSWLANMRGIRFHKSRGYPEWGYMEEADAVRRFWHLYNERLHELEDVYPDHVRVFWLEHLNSRIGQEAILSWAYGRWEPVDVAGILEGYVQPIVR